MMDAGRVFGRGISFPPRLGPDGRVAWSAGPDNVRECIRVLLLTELGERIRLPEFGGSLRALLGDPNTVSTRRLVQQRIEDALRLWEPRVAVDSVQVEEADEDAAAAIATITYRLVATQATERTTLRVQLNG
jgi:phage baseplate assembly protein W